MTSRGKLTFAMLCLLFVMNAKAQEIRDLLPSLGELPGWKLNKEPQVYEGDNLFELINGGADIYLEYGFSKVLSAQYTDPSQNNILVEIYEMTDPSAAYGIFSITQQSLAWSDEFGTFTAVKEDYISFWKSKYYINLSWSSRQHTDAPLIAKLAGQVTERIREEADYPDLVNTFSVNEPGINAIFYKGNIALSNFYYFDYKDIFSVKKGIAANFGNYYRIIIQYPEPDDAQEILTFARNSFATNKRFSDITNAFQGFSCSDNKANHILVRQVDEFIVALVGLDQSVPLVSLMDDISLKIESADR